MRKSVVVSAFVLAVFVGTSAAIAASPVADAASPAASSTSGGVHPWHSMHGWQHGQHWGRGQWHGHRGWHRHAAFRRFRDLDLTAAQRDDIHKLTRASFQHSAPEWNALRQKRAAFEQATPGTPEYVAASNDLAHAEADAALAAVLRRSDLRTKIYAVLTPAQRSKLAADQAQWRSRRQAWQKSHARTSS